MPKINIQVDYDRLNELLTVDEYLGMQEGDFKTTIEVLSMFIVDDDGNYLSQEEGRKIIGKIAMQDLPPIMEAFTEMLQDKASPPEKGRG